MCSYVRRGTWGTIVEGRIRCMALEKICLRYMVLFFEFGSIASKQNLFSSMTFCQFWAANGVKSGIKRPLYP